MFLLKIFGSKPRGRPANETDTYKRDYEERQRVAAAQRVNEVKRSKKEFRDLFNPRDFAPPTVEPQEPNSDPYPLPSSLSAGNLNPDTPSTRSITPTPGNANDAGTSLPQFGVDGTFAEKLDSMKTSLGDIMGLMEKSSSTLRNEMTQLHDYCVILSSRLEDSSTPGLRPSTDWNHVIFMIQHDLNETKEFLERWSGKNAIIERFKYKDIVVRIRQLQSQFDRHLSVFNAMRIDANTSATEALSQELSRIQNDTQRSPDSIGTQAGEGDEDIISQQVLALTSHAPDASYILKGRVESYEIRAQWEGDLFNVYKGRLKGSGKAIAIKMYRGTHKDDPHGIRAVERILRQVQLWSSFDSCPNILPCLGLGMQITKVSDDDEVYDEFQLYLVSPWMKNRDAIRYIAIGRRKTPLPAIEILRYIQHVALGVQYLHTHNPPCVHASIRGENVIIKDDNTACLNGFGLTKAYYGDKQIELTGKKFGVRWMAPELLSGDKPPLLPSCDIWSWAMTALELTSGKMPYYQFESELHLRDEIRKGTRPQRGDYPAFERYCAQPDLMWQLLERCWATEALARPTINQIVVELERIQLIQIQQQTAPHVWT